MKTKAKISLLQTLEKNLYHLNVLLGPPKAWEGPMQTITLMLKLPKWQGKSVSTSAAHQIASPLLLLFRFSGTRIHTTVVLGGSLTKDSSLEDKRVAPELNQRCVHVASQAYLEHISTFSSLCCKVF